MYVLYSTSWHLIILYVLRLAVYFVCIVVLYGNGLVVGKTVQGLWEPVWVFGQHRYPAGRVMHAPV